MKTFVIIPTYNEKNNIESLVTSIFNLIPNINILVVDDNSPDGTANLVLQLMKKFSNLSILNREKKEGLGRAYIDAFKKLLKDSSIDIIIMMDADLSHNPDYLPLMLEKIKEKDIVIGSRYIKGGKVVGWSLYRKILSFGGNFYCRIITRMPINDCTGGYNVIRTSVLRKIDLNKLNLSGYAFLMGLKYMLFTSGFTIMEIPIVFNDRICGVSKISNNIILEGIIAPWKMYWTSVKTNLLKNTYGNKQK